MQIGRDGKDATARAAAAAWARVRPERGLAAFGRGSGAYDVKLQGFRDAAAAGQVGGGGFGTAAGNGFDIVNGETAVEGFNFVRNGGEGYSLGFDLNVAKTRGAVGEEGECLGHGGGGVHAGER